MFGKKKAVAAPAPTSEPVKPSGMVDLRKTAKVSLAKHGLEVDGTGGVAVYLVLDHSYSMQGHYARGDVQRITEQVLALSAEIDDDGKVPVFYFGSHAEKPVIADVSKHQGWVNKTHTKVQWGGTNYIAAIDAVRAYHAKHGGGQPALVVFQTDGSPDSQPATKAKLREVSGENVFYAFVGFGPKYQVQFLFELDTIDGRVRDNASAFHAEDPQRTKDSDLYDGVLGEFVGDFLPEVL
jgi:hypothetical protein